MSELKQYQTYISLVNRVEFIMPWTQIRIEVFLAQMVKSTQKMSKILSTLELLAMLLALFLKQFRYVIYLELFILSYAL